MEAFQVAYPPIFQSELDDDFLPMVADNILSEAALVHVCGCARDLARLQIMLFLPDDPLLKKTEVELIFIMAEPSVFAEGVIQPGSYGVFRWQLVNGEMPGISTAMYCQRTTLSRIVCLR